MKIGNIISHPIFVVGLTFLTSGVWGIIWIIYLSTKLETTDAVPLLNSPSLSSHYVRRNVAIVFFPIYIMAQCFAVPNELGYKRAYIGMKPRTGWWLGLFPVFALIVFIFYFFAGDVIFTELSHEEYWEIFNVIVIIMFASELIWLFVVQYFLNDYMDEREMQREVRKEKSALNRKRRKNKKPLPYMTGAYQKKEDLPPLELSDFESITNDDELNSEESDNSERKDDYWNDYESRFENNTEKIDED